MVNAIMSPDHSHFVAYDEVDAGEVIYAIKSFLTSKGYTFRCETWLLPKCQLLSVTGSIDRGMILALHLQKKVEFKAMAAANG